MSESKKHMKVVKDYDMSDHKALQRLLELEPDLLELIERERTRKITMRLVKMIAPIAICLLVLGMFVASHYIDLSVLLGDTPQ